MNLRFGRQAKVTDPSFISILGVRTVSWCTVDSNLRHVCACAANFVPPKEFKPFKNPSKAESAFNSAITLLRGQIKNTYGNLEEKFFDSYQKWVSSGGFGENVARTPALVPETIIEIPHEYYGNKESFSHLLEPRLRNHMRVDFFWRDRTVCDYDIVIEIDGNSHFEPVGEEKLLTESPESDIERMRVFTNHTIRHRALVLGGFKVYRFSIWELERPNIDELLHPFFNRVFR